MLNGVIVINKEPGFTSSNVISKLRGILQMKKIGHTGTLDPEAVGVLPVCLGNATKLTELIADHDKEYTAVMRLGLLTDTQDMTGTVLAEFPGELRELTEQWEQQPDGVLRKIQEAAAALTGHISQTPPMYSAVRVNGQHLYELARAGQTVERKAREIAVYELDILSVKLPEIRIHVRCSKGTYIRTLCEDLGRLLGTGAAMQYLQRTRVGIFSLDQALTLKEIEKLVHGEMERTGLPQREAAESCMRERLIPTDAFFEKAPKVTVQTASAPYLQNGNPMSFKDTDMSAELIRQCRAEAERAENAPAQTATSGKAAVSGRSETVGEVKSSGQTADGRTLLRMYDPEGMFRALYIYSKESDQLIVYKMFPEQQ